MHTDYERLAARYDEDRLKWAVPRDELIDELLASRPSMRVLDLGCGTGRWISAQLNTFAGRRIEWFGVDPSAGMLSAASAKGLANLVLAGAEALPLPDASFDYVACSFCFHHFTDKERALDEICRILTSRGAFRMNNIDPAAAGDWWLYEFFPDAVAIDEARFWLPARIGEALEVRRFAVDIRIDSERAAIPAAEALADAERRVVSQLAMLDDAAYTRGLMRLRKVASSPGATVNTTDSRLLLTARRSP